MRIEIVSFRGKRPEIKVRIEDLKEFQRWSKISWLVKSLIEELSPEKELADQMLDGT